MHRLGLILVIFLMLFPGLTWSITYYVSPTGDDTNGDGSESNPWRTISHAVSNASDGDIIKVMDDDNDNTDDYVENVVVNKQLTIEAYDNDGTLPTIKSATGGTEAIFKLTADETVIRKLRVYGTSNTGGSGIWINNANSCKIEEVQTGWASGKQCYYGVSISGGAAGKNKYNLIYNCQLNQCYESGVYLDGASMNSIIDNEFNSGKNGISFANGATCNMVSGNTISNSTNAAISLAGDVSNSIFAMNIMQGYSNNYGIYDNSSGTHYVYLNEFRNDQSSFKERFYSPTRISYLFKHVITFKNFIGNYYMSNEGFEPITRDDPEMEGVARHFEYRYNQYARYPLIFSTDQYYLYIWYLANPVMYRGNAEKEFKTITLSGGGSQVWAADEAAIDNVHFPASPSTDSTTWSGLLTFSSAPASGDAFNIYVGYADDQNGTNFTQGGPEATITGDGSKAQFDFICSANSFTVPQGKYLAIKIVNTSSTSYDLMVGGAWSYVTSPAASQRYPRTSPSPLDVMYVSYNGNDLTGTGTLDAPLRSFRSAISVISSGKTIKVIDDNQSSTHDFQENVTVDKSLTIEPYQNDNTPPDISGYSSSKNGFNVTANNVTIRNMRITHSYGGIYAQNVSNGTITGNSFNDNAVGIFLKNCTSFNVSGNSCTSNGGSGIELEGCTSCNVSGNTCSGNTHGIMLDGTTNSTFSNNQCNSNGHSFYVSNGSHGNTISENKCSNTVYNGIRISDSNQNQIIGNTCNSNNYRGIVVYRGSYTFIYDNTCNQNGYDGIRIEQGDWNVVAHNTISANNDNGIQFSGYGYPIYDYSKYNCLAYNDISNNSDYGIRFYSYASDNEVFANTIHDNTQAGIYNKYNNNNTAYFNDLTNNGKTVDDDGAFSAVSSRKMGYLYGSLQVTRKEYLGNYYSDYTGSDADGNGIGDSPYAGDGFNDGNPLIQSISKYNLQTWFLQTNSYMKRDVTNGYGTLTVNGGSSVILVDPQAAQEKIDFGAGDQGQTTSWTGRIWLTSNNEYNFTIQIGYADADGSNFNPSGCSDNPSGTGSYYFYFATTASEFDVPKGKHLAVRITNNLSGGKASKDIIIGGTYSYISAPIQSEDYSLPITLTSFTATAQPEGVLLEWTTGSEINNAGFHIYRATSKEGPFTRITPHLIPGAGNSTISHSYSFLDKQVVDGQTYWYKLQDIAFDGSGTFHPAISITYHPGNLANTEIPKRFYLNPAFPNPFNNSTKITYGVPEPAKISLKIYDVRGRLVRTLVAGEKAAGHYHTYWNGRNDLGEAVASGVYFLRLETTYLSRTRRILLLK